MQLHTVPQRKNRVMSKMKVGRGYGSGKGGHTSTRGSKGQKSRTGHKSMVMFEGGQTPFFRRMPKFPGFKNRNRKDYQSVNLSIIEKNFEDGSTLNLVTLQEKGLVRKDTTLVKILGNGELTKKVHAEGLQYSESAKKAILAVKGTVK